MLFAKPINIDQNWSLTAFEHDSYAYEASARNDLNIWKPEELQMAFKCAGVRAEKGESAVESERWQAMSGIMNERFSGGVFGMSVCFAVGNFR